MDLLKAGKRSRRLAVAGDVFTIKLGDSMFVGGRVVWRLPRDSPMLMECLLVYLYKWVYPTIPAVEEVLRRSAPADLLTPPLFVPDVFFRSGHACVLGHADLQDQDKLKAHCFSSVLHENVYVDEHDRTLPGRFEPCGVYGVHQKGAIEIELRRAFDAGVAVFV